MCMPYYPPISAKIKDKMHVFYFIGKKQITQGRMNRFLSSINSAESPSKYIYRIMFFEESSSLNNICLQTLVAL